MMTISYNISLMSRLTLLHLFFKQLKIKKFVKIEHINEDGMKDDRNR